MTRYSCTREGMVRKTTGHWVTIDDVLQIIDENTALRATAAKGEQSIADRMDAAMRIGIKTQTLITERDAMNTINKQRCLRGEALAFDDAAFFELAERFRALLPAKKGGEA